MLKYTDMFVENNMYNNVIYHLYDIEIEHMSELMAAFLWPKHLKKEVEAKKTEINKIAIEDG